MFERFTDESRRVLMLAQQEARLLRHNFIGTEHLLLGLVREGEGVAAQALGSLGVTLEAVREKVEEAIGPIDAATSASPPFTPRSKKVLELSLREAVEMGGNHIGTEHLLLGLVREGEGVAAQVLVVLGADLLLVRERVIQLLGGRRVEDLPRPGPPPSSDPPNCPRCRASLTTTAAYRVIQARGDLDDEDARFVVVYCSRCGTALGTAS